MIKNTIGPRYRTLDDETFQALLRFDWGAIGNELLGVAINYSQKYPSIGYKTCDDIVQDVIEKTLRGRSITDPESGETLAGRSWDPRKGELLPWLKWCIKSELDNSAKKLATKNEFLLIDRKNDVDFEIGINPRIAVLAESENPTDPETILVQKEKEALFNREIDGIYGFVQGNEALEELVLAMACHIDEDKTLRKPKRRELANYLDVSVDEINNRFKRLRRHLLKVKVD